MGEMRTRLDRAARLRSGDEQRAIDGTDLGDPCHRGRVGGVEHVQLESAGRRTRRLVGAGDHLGEQARAAHAGQDHVGELLGDELGGQALQAGGLGPHLGHDMEPAQPVGDLGRVVLPQGVVAGPDAFDRVPGDQVVKGGVDIGGQVAQPFLAGRFGG